MRLGTLEPRGSDPLERQGGKLARSAFLSRFHAQGGNESMALRLRCSSLKRDILPPRALPQRQISSNAPVPNL
jgi:hypothetical protein